MEPTVRISSADIFLVINGKEVEDPGQDLKIERNIWHAKLFWG